MASCIVFPCPIRMPALLFLLCMLVHVTIRSPIPESPENVSGFPPIATPSLVISAIPLVIRAAFVLSPQPRPSLTPAARAMTFLSAPPSSIPKISGLVYTRKTDDINKFWMCSAVCLSFAPTTTVVGMPRLTSSAWLGPERTATFAIGSSCSICWDIVINVFSSMPFATLTISCPSFTKGFICFATPLVNTDGTDKTSISLSVHASCKSAVNTMLLGISTPGRFLHL